MMNKLISIHAPVKGATLCCTLESLLNPHFNPRTREGCDNERGDSD